MAKSSTASKPKQKAKKRRKAQPQPQSEEWVEVGQCGVDAGILWLGDPCYILHRDGDSMPPSDIGENWSDFCEKLSDGAAEATQFHHDNDGHVGLGVVVPTGLGDGVYPVEVRYADAGEGWGKRIAEVRVRFLPHPVPG